MIDGQFAAPRGVLGRVVGWVMARANARLTRRVVGALVLSGSETVVEIGPGPGVGLVLLAGRLPRGRVFGVEPSAVMRAQAAGRVRGGRVTLLDATAASLSLPAGSVDAVCAVNNVQLWRPLPGSLARVFEVLRPGGVLAVGVTERAVLPEGGGVGRGFDQVLLPRLVAAGFEVVSAVWEPGGNGQELLIVARRP
ncbi:class I SAM-dependent methyltransferase [Actinoplanes sp. L3-i22]|uniref:class I SAM-dependent methyltransferase n=1 Tax=Actinoplanes sp. L3-i22 TaxID=2836373 RepID=UPI001C798F3C|nr:class I SAM-dependent methyltransferase [Actinoplanes sp. L3-i22]BCY10375.1 methyltransferase [Actinoplanes sp. L3-i22]